MQSSPAQVDLSNQVPSMDMYGDQYYDDQVFADMGGAQNQPMSMPMQMPMSMPKPQAVEVVHTPVVVKQQSPVAKQVSPVVKQKTVAPYVVPPIASTATVQKQKVGDGYYALHFSLFYETIVGQSLAVIGNLEELGKWKTIKCNLIWTEGHIWCSTKPIIVRESYFEYKYVLLEDDQVSGWEEGVNRIADLDHLPQITDFRSEKKD